MEDDSGLPRLGCHWCQGLLPQLPGPVAFPVAEKERVTLDVGKILVGDSVEG